jgi:hypothetical protein
MGAGVLGKDAFKPRACLAVAPLWEVGFADQVEGLCAQLRELGFGKVQDGLPPGARFLLLP